MPIYGDIVHRIEKEIEALSELAPFEFTLGGTCKIEKINRHYPSDIPRGTADLPLDIHRGFLRLRDCERMRGQVR